MNLGNGIILGVLLIVTAIVLFVLLSLNSRNEVPEENSVLLREDSGPVYLYSAQGAEGELVTCGTCDPLTVFNDASVFNSRVLTSQANSNFFNRVNSAINDDGSVVVSLNEDNLSVFEWDGSVWTTRYTVDLLLPGLRVEVQTRRVSISGDGSVIAIIYNDASQVEVYAWDGSTYNSLGTPIPYSETLDGDRANIAMSKDSTSSLATIIYSLAREQVARVYEWDGVSWTQKGADFTSTSTDYGYDVDISADGNIVAITVGNDDIAELYEWNGSSWDALPFSITSPDFTAVSISISDDGNTVALGRTDGNLGILGFVYVVDRLTNFTTSFAPDDSLLPAFFDGGSPFPSEFGRDLQLSRDGNKLCVGQYNGEGSPEGSVWVYAKCEGMWTLIAGHTTEDGIQHNAMLSGNGCVFGTSGSLGVNPSATSGVFVFDLL